MRGHARTIALCALWLAGLAGLAHAGERPVIQRVRLSARDGLVTAEIRCADLFSERVVGTVESGLPAVVELLYRLVLADGKQRRRGVHAYEIVYDVWDDVYRLESGDTVRTFGSFDDLGHHLERLRGVAIAPIGGLDANASYAVEFAIAVHPLRATEREEVVGWVDEEVLGQSGGGWRERVLNVGDLIHSLFSREREETFRSDWHRSALFTPASLRRENSLRGVVPAPRALAAGGSGGGGGGGGR